MQQSIPEPPPGCKPLSTRALVALSLVATGLDSRDAATHAGMSYQRVRQLRLRPDAKAYVIAQREVYLEELRRARILAQLGQDSATLRQRTPRARNTR